MARAIAHMYVLLCLFSCSYAGEWFEMKGEPGKPPEPLHEQREAAVHNLWVAAAIYGAFGALSGIAVCSHKVRGNL